MTNNAAAHKNQYELLPLEKSKIPIEEKIKLSSVRLCVRPSMVMYINSSIVNNILYAIWYDMLNIANNGAAKYGNIQKSRTTVNSSIVSLCIRNS
jgi:hypothetical protein